MTDQNQPPPLGDIPETTAYELVASGFGATPVIGPLIQTVLNKMIPNVRAERAEAYIRYLQEQIDELNLKLALEKPEGLDLFEEGLWQSARAFTEKRKKYIGELVVCGLKSEEAEQSRVRHNLRILNQISDEEIIILTSYQHKYMVLNGDEVITFRDKNRSILGPFMDTVKAAHKDSLLTHLASFGLLRIVEEDLSKNKVKYALTTQGKILLEYIGLLEKSEKNIG